MGKTILRGGRIFTKEGFLCRNVLIEDGRLCLDFSNTRDAVVYPMEGMYIVPGFVDVHVHLREPGFSYKESIRTGTMAAAHGGYTAVCAMPNLNPPPSSLSALQEELSIIERDALVHVYPYGCITRAQSGRGTLSDMEAIAPYVFAFSDDGKGVQDIGLMREAMRRAKALGKPIVAHCEDEAELRPGGAVHEGEYARRHGHIGISSASEWKQVARDLALAGESGVQYHVCHVSSRESVELIRKAKAEGVRASGETGPHYLMFTDMELEEDGKWKMNPPIRSEKDRAALLSGLRDGTIDCLITDHAPHSMEEKARGLDGSAFGIVGLECAFPALYHNLVLRNPEKSRVRVDRSPSLLPGDMGKDEAARLTEMSAPGVLSLWQLIELLATRPRQLFSLPGPRYISEGEEADITVLDMRPVYWVDSRRFYSKGHSTLFDGMEVQGEVVKTFVGGREVYDRERGFQGMPEGNGGKGLS